MHHYLLGRQDSLQTELNNHQCATGCTGKSKGYKGDVVIVTSFHKIYVCKYITYDYTLLHLNIKLNKYILSLFSRFSCVWCQD